MHGISVGRYDDGTVGGWYDVFAEITICWGNILASGACIYSGLIV